MSFGTYARKVRDGSLPYGRRVSELRSCVQLYGPIGFHATLGFLTEIAGRYQRDEVALLRALDALEASRAGWHAAVRDFARRRRQAKRRGQRVPRVGEVNPSDKPQIWYGAAGPAARYALRHWDRGPFAELTATSDDTADTVGVLVAAVLSARGGLTPEQWQRLECAVTELRRRVRSDLWHHDPRAYYLTWNLLKMARLVESAALPG